MKLKMLFYILPVLAVAAVLAFLLSDKTPEYQTEIRSVGFGDERPLFHWQRIITNKETLTNEELVAIYNKYVKNSPYRNNIISLTGDRGFQVYDNETLIAEVSYNKETGYRTEVYRNLNFAKDFKSILTDTSGDMLAGYKLFTLVDEDTLFPRSRWHLLRTNQETVPDELLIHLYTKYVKNRQNAYLIIGLKGDNGIKISPFTPRIYHLRYNMRGRTLDIFQTCEFIDDNKAIGKCRAGSK